MTRFLNDRLIAMPLICVGERQSEMPLVSICIPVYNVEQYLRRCLDSAVCQTLKDIEIIVVDDGSTDASVDIVREYVEQDHRVRLICHNQNRSLLQARKTAVSDARGDYIQFLDSDDALRLDACELLSQIAVSKGADVVHFGTSIIDTNGNHLIDFERNVAPKVSWLEGDEILPVLFCSDWEPQSHLCLKFWKRNLVDFAYTQIPDSLYLYRAEDVLIHFIALTRASVYVSIDINLYIYFFGSGVSGKKKHDLSSFEVYLRSIDSITEIEKYIHRAAFDASRAQDIKRAYERLRLFIISIVVRDYCSKLNDSDLRMGLEMMLNEFSVEDARNSLSMFNQKLSERLDYIISMLE
jgi:glycosyltransferase involved in cell wall biosynthesis